MTCMFFLVIDLSNAIPAPLVARATNGTVSSSISQGPTPSASNQLEHTGSAAVGATATLSADTAQGTCTFNNDLDGNQQASWTESIVTTCCTGEKTTTCWYRIQAKVDAADACKIPVCADLNSNDPERMAAFRPLSGTNGEGKYQNIFPILFLSSGLKTAIPLLLFVIAPICASLVLLL